MKSLESAKVNLLIYAHTLFLPTVAPRFPTGHPFHVVQQQNDPA
jgi:hypothetical protein